MFFFFLITVHDKGHFLAVKVPSVTATIVIALFPRFGEVLFVSVNFRLVQRSFCAVIFLSFPTLAFSLEELPRKSPIFAFVNQVPYFNTFKA